MKTLQEGQRISIELRVTVENKSTRLRRNLVHRRGACPGAYQDMCRGMQQSRGAKEQAEWGIYL